MLGFEERGKPEYSEKTSRCRVEDQQTLGIEPGPHWWEASALTTASSLTTAPFKEGKGMNEVNLKAESRFPETWLTYQRQFYTCGQTEALF